MFLRFTCAYDRLAMFYLFVIKLLILKRYIIPTYDIIDF